MNTKNRIAVSDLKAKSDIRGGATKTSTATMPTTVKPKGKKGNPGSIDTELPADPGLGR